MLPAIILFNKKKIKGKTKKGLLIYKTISLIDNKIYYVPTKINSNENKYVLIKPNPLNETYATLEIVLAEDNKKAEELALLYKYNLFYKTKIKMAQLSQMAQMAQVSQGAQVAPMAPIISIDPKGCIDIDDAFSIEYLDNKINRINIFIATILPNAQEFSPNYSTIYNIYNNNLSLFDKDITYKMSLLAGLERKSVMITYDCLKNEFIGWSIQNIIVAANLDYDTALNTKYSNDINNLMAFFSIFDIHKIIEKLMLLVNNYMAKEIKNVIYRNQSPLMPANYSFTNLGHKTLNMAHYCHFTSPIRRYVDYINHYLLIGTQVEINLDEINNKIINIKKFYRDMNIIKLYYIINDNFNGYHITKARIIYYYNDEYCLLYLPEFDLKINYLNKFPGELFDIEIACKKSNIITDKLLIKPKS